MVSLISITVFLLFQIYIGNCLNIPIKENRELDEYTNEFTRLLQNSTGIEKSSMENYSGRHYEDLLMPDGVLHSDNQGLSSDVVSEGSSSISSGEVPESSDHAASSEKVHDFRPFIIDDGIDLSPTTSQSMECILDRKQITLIFQECIYHDQTKSPMLGKKNVTISEPNLRDYDAQFLKYCRRAPELRECVKNFIKTTKASCLDEGDHETINNIEEVTTHVTKFVCNKEADRISIFIEDGGLECLLSRHYRMYTCLFFNIGNYALISIAELSSLELSALKCTSIRGAEQCITQELELCEHQVSAIATGVLFNIIKEIGSCEDSSEDVTELPLRESGSEVKETEASRNIRSHLPDQLEHIESSSSVEASEDVTELPLREFGSEAQVTEANRNIRSHLSDQVEHIKNSSSIEASASDSPSKLSTFTPTVDTGNGGQNTRDEDTTTASSPKVDTAMVHGEPIYPGILLTTTMVGSLGIDDQIPNDEYTMTTSSPKVEGLFLDAQKQQGEDEMPTSSSKDDSDLVHGIPIHPEKDPLSTPPLKYEGVSGVGKNKMSTTSPVMKFDVSQNSIYNAVLDTHNSSTATAGILCALVLFYSVIILSYKCMIKNNMKL